MLSQAGCNILITHQETKSNALHVAIERKHYSLALNLVMSIFPINNR